MPQPFVSVIIPAYNGAERLKKVLNALQGQTYPDDRFEVLVVDNGSTDRTPEVIAQSPFQGYEETDVQGPYAARNTGIKHSKGEIIALLDATCIPNSDWLEAGIECFGDKSIDLVGGQVTFDLGDDPSPAEIYDSKGNVQMERNIRERNVAKTGNLFFRRDVFETIGPFPHDLRSGGDVLWTGKATRSGFNLVYCADAEVHYPAKQFHSLVRKQYRVGKGRPNIWEINGKEPVEAVLSGVLAFPMKVINTFGSDSGNSTSEANDDEAVSPAVIMVGAICYIAQLLGTAVTLVSIAQKD
ncbi:glycosyltransferase [Halalkalicoccus jeotgali]|uniref:Glycosyltransferase AglE n=1 Tax=Halalkalicoccus jeotgali (strain DSM 18796 / CECT 7217 / JCM 14584 / KCTC 4019 / B3) TaxID=795797 RepID=D8J752_HALJB|nr:glycosyltransferase [Halalkalicoccus jeotgali]ADJ13947.1 glycosyltransferase AglE [Halalkalicoccus jeotgali B3]ELY34009.1 glycosyltransferase AglE [Halalkalicoccus jeotgali B3]